MIKCDSAVIFDIYRGTTHDGPGLRSTVFFKGCPLRCLWCHNPEGIETGIEVWQDVQKCIGCGLCEKACKNTAICHDADGVFTNKERCLCCGACVSACPTNAMKFTGQSYTLDELMHVLLKDKAFYSSFSGGVTASGGEPLLQSEFISSLFEKLHENGIHTALDTCGFVSYDKFEKVLPYTELVLYDLKIADDELHKKLTGQSNTLIMENILKVADYIKSSGKKLWIRTPLIPNATADEENIRKLAQFIKENIFDAVERWELCAFNNVCRMKYKKMRKSWIYDNEPMLDPQIANLLKTVAEESGVGVVVSGII